MSGNWRDSAACTTVDPEIFFADEDNKWLPSAMAFKVCASCPKWVQAECLADTPSTDHWSIRGGLTWRQRQRRRNAA